MERFIGRSKTEAETSGIRAFCIATCRYSSPRFISPIRTLITFLVSLLASSEGTRPVYLVQWTLLDENEGAVEERQRWVTEESMTTAPIVSLLSSMSKRRTSEKISRSVEGRDNLDEEDYSEGEVGSCKRTRDMLDDSEDEDDSESDAEPQRRKFEEGPLAREARLKREQRRRESRARKRPRKSRRVEGDDSSNSNNDDVPLTKEDKERQQKEFLRVLYNNRDYKPVILFFDRNA